MTGCCSALHCIALLGLSLTFCLLAAGMRDIRAWSIILHLAETLYMGSLLQGLTNTDSRFIAIPDGFVNLIPTVRFEIEPKISAISGVFRTADACMPAIQSVADVSTGCLDPGRVLSPVLRCAHPVGGARAHPGGHPAAEHQCADVSADVLTFLLAVSLNQMHMS